MSIVEKLRCDCKICFANGKSFKVSSKNFHSEKLPGKPPYCFRVISNFGSTICNNWKRVSNSISFFAFGKFNSNSSSLGSVSPIFEKSSSNSIDALVGKPLEIILFMNDELREKINEINLNLI